MPDFNSLLLKNTPYYDKKKGITFFSFFFTSPRIIYSADIKGDDFTYFGAPHYDTRQTLILRAEGETPHDGSTVPNQSMIVGTEQSLAGKPSFVTMKNIPVGQM